MVTLPTNLHKSIFSPLACDPGNMCPKIKKMIKFKGGWGVWKFGNFSQKIPPINADGFPQSELILAHTSACYFTAAELISQQILVCIQYRNTDQ